MEFSAFVYFLHAPSELTSGKYTNTSSTKNHAGKKGLNPVPAMRDMRLKHENGGKFVRTIMKLTFILHISRLNAYLSNNKVTCNLCAIEISDSEAATRMQPSANQDYILVLLKVSPSGHKDNNQTSGVKLTALDGVILIVISTSKLELIKVIKLLSSIKITPTK